MSRVGKKPIPVPSGVKIQIGEQLKVQGPKGTLEVPIPAGIRVQQNDGKLEILRDSDEHAALHGLTRALAANAVQGVSTGFTRELDIVGIGYRADVKGKIATFTLGYSHPIEVLLPDGVDLKIDKQTHLVLSGYDQAVAGPGGGQYSRAAQAGSLQEQGRPLYGRSAEEEGRQVRRDRRQEIMIRKKLRKNETRGRVHDAHPQEAARHAASVRVWRFSVSVAHIYAQVIDDTKGVTVVAASSIEAKNERRDRAAMWRRRRKSASVWPSAPKKKASRKWYSIAAAISIMAA